MAIYNQRAEFSQEQFESHFQKRNSVLSTIYGIFRFLVIIVENLYCIPSYLILSWLVLLPTNWFKNGLYSRLENYLYNSLVFIVSSWSLAAGLTVVETGDEFKHLIEEPERYHSEKGDSVNDKLAQRINGFNNAESQKLLSNYDSIPAYREKIRQIRDHSPERKPLGTYYRVAKADDVNNSLTYIDDIDKEVDLKGKQSDEIRQRNRSNNHIDQSPEKAPFKNNNNELEEKTVEKIRWKNSSIVGANPRSVPREASVDTPFSVDDENNMLKPPQAKPRILFLCNHISTADVPLMMQSFSTLTNQSLLWVLDAQFKLTNFGVVCGSHGDFFVSKNSYVDGSLREHVLKYPDRNLLVLFPEGGFLRKRIEGSNRYAKRNGLPPTTYVTHPRFGAFKDLIDPSVGVTHIVDATLIYDNIKDPISILDIGLGSKKEPAILHFKLYNRSEINPNEEWLRKIWSEKDKMLSDYYNNRTNSLREFAKTFRVAKLDWFKVLSIHLFYLLVCYLAIIRLFNATSATMLKARELYYTNI